MSDSSSHSANIPALTGLRTVAAGLVFFFHWFFTHASHLPLAVRGPFEIGYVGVPIFFALSGFLITLRYEAPFREGRIGYGRYMLKRVIRIVPLYLVVLIFFVFAFGRPTNMIPADARQTIILLTVTQALFPSTMLIGTTVGWTLTIEFIYYLLAPLLLKRLRVDAPLIQIVFWFLVFSAVGLFGGWLLASVPPNNWDTLAGEPLFYIWHYSIFGNLPDFMIGMVAALLYLRRGEWMAFVSRYRWLIWLSTAGMYGMMLLLAVDSGELGSPSNRFLSFSIALFASGLILGTSLDQKRQSLLTRVLGSRVMVYLGVTSYALYLIQLTEPIQWLYWLLLGEYLSIDNQVWRAILLYGLAVPISAVLYEVVEKPLHRWFTRLTRPKAPPQAET